MGYNPEIETLNLHSDEAREKKTVSAIQQLSYLEDIFQAYENKISTLEKLLKDMQAQLSKTDSDFYEITRENNHLRKELENKTQ